MGVAMPPRKKRSITGGKSTILKSREDSYDIASWVKKWWCSTECRRKMRPRNGRIRCIGPLWPKYSAAFATRKPAGRTSNSFQLGWRARVAAKRITAIEPAVVKAKCNHPEYQRPIYLARYSARNFAVSEGTSSIFSYHGKPATADQPSPR